LFNLPVRNGMKRSIQKNEESPEGKKKDWENRLLSVERGSFHKISGKKLEHKPLKAPGLDAEKVVDY